MAAIRTTGIVIVRGIFRPSASPPSLRTFLWTVPPPVRFVLRPISYSPVRCAAVPDSGGNKKTSAWLSQVQQQLQEAVERSVGGDEPIPKITLVFFLQTADIWSTSSTADVIRRLQTFSCRKNKQHLTLDLIKMSHVHIVFVCLTSLGTLKCQDSVVGLVHAK